MNSVETGQGRVYFVYGYGCTGKTFLWKTFAASIRRNGDIVLNVASNGIASLLMSRGRTTHSRFHIPINIDETSNCSICPQSDLGALLKKCKLIIWDEAPMTNKLCFEALDRTLRDILRRTMYDTCETPFGNMTMVFGGDFRQVLPVIKLTTNMRLTVGARPEDVCEIRDFAEWILKVRDGELGEANDGEVSIDVPEELLIDAVDDPVTSIIDFTYLNLLDNINDPS
ncbi:ATP-dependent DNA helicase PIF1-like protein [Tanacetum coccineum]